MAQLTRRAVRYFSTERGNTRYGRLAARNTRRRPTGRVVRRLASGVRRAAARGSRVHTRFPVGRAALLNKGGARLANQIAKRRTGRVVLRRVR